MTRAFFALLTLSVLSGCMSMAEVPPEQRRDDRWRQTSEMLSRPPTGSF